ncbi:hypothetical protein [Streptomyces sp. GSL17-111]|uniref:hypothetical protein n=1 Tax=Streptomyces sp. GSL17-111 TaxID=3121596 RepID=UPI0030F41397
MESPAAYGDTFWWFLVLVLAMFVPALLMPRRPPAEDAGDGDGPVPAVDRPASAGA